MAVDPWLNSAYQDPHGHFWAGEVCDPVEDDEYGYEINGVLVTDFVTPNWFAHPYAKGAIHLKGHALAPFEVLRCSGPGSLDGHSSDPSGQSMAARSVLGRHRIQPSSDALLQIVADFP
jgi:hypothetical protein